MPVVFRHNGLRYYFFSNEGQPPEAIHIHINISRAADGTQRSGLSRRFQFPTVMASIHVSFRIS
jgi:hypothetical protein